MPEEWKFTARFLVKKPKNKRRLRRNNWFRFFSEFLNAEKVCFFGDGAEKCKEIITHKNAIFIDGKFPSANEMSAISYEKYVKHEFEDVAYFEPFYLKNF